MSQVTKIKICGLSTLDAVEASIQGGATHMGMVFFEKSPRHISFEVARQLAAHAGKRICKVPVTVNADNALLEKIIEATSADAIQLHGQETPARVLEVKQKFTLPVWKAISISQRQDLSKITPYIEVVDKFLFDAKPPKDSVLPGGNGVAFDWEILDDLPNDISYILSGGLDPDNINEAINKSGALGVDVSSGIEATPGVKDLDKIARFIANARQIKGTNS